MKKFLFLFFILGSLAAFAQKPKIYSGVQTTYNNLTRYGSGAPTFNPSGSVYDTLAFSYIDTSQNTHPIIYEWAKTKWFVTSELRQPNPPMAVQTVPNPDIDNTMAIWIDTDAGNNKFYYDQSEGAWHPIGNYQGATAPVDLAATGSTGAVSFRRGFWYDTSTSLVKSWNGTAWVSAGADNWGSQNVVSSIRFTGLGTTGSPLELAFSGITPNNYTLLNATIDIYGRVTAAANGTVNLASQVTNFLAPNFGGTGFTTYAVGDMLYASGTTAFSKLGLGTNGQLLRVNSGGTAPEWFTHSFLTSNQTITLTGAVTGSGTTSIVTTLAANIVLTGNIQDGTIVIADLAFTPWHAGNDGTGSGLDADLLDGQSGAYYLAFGNHTGTVNLATQVSGTLPATNGGTGFASYAVGDILYASTTTALSKLADVATGNALISGGVGVAPAWGKIGLTTHVSGILAFGNGGTGVSTIGTAGQLARVNSGATGLEYFTASYSTISGLTINYVTKATGAGTIGNSSIFDNGTSVGINETSLLAKFHIKGSGTTTSTKNIMTANSAGVEKFSVNDFGEGAFDAGLLNPGSPSYCYYGNAGNSSYASGYFSPGTSDFTVEFYFNLASLSVANYLSDGNANCFGIYVNTDGRVAKTKSGVSDLTVAPAGTITAGKWYHVTYSRTGSTGVCMVNGVAQTAVTDANDYSGQTTKVGVLGYMNGSISLARMYNKALTATEVKRLFNNGRPDLSHETGYGWGSYTPIYSSNYGVDFTGLTTNNGTLTANIDGIGGQNDNLRFVFNAVNGQHAVKLDNALTVGQIYRIRFSYYIPSTNITFASFRIWNSNQNLSYTSNLSGNDSWISVDVEFTSRSTGLHFISTQNLSDTDILYLRGMTIEKIGVLVSYLPNAASSATWYDSSPNNYHLTNTNVLAFTPSDKKQVLGDIYTNVVYNAAGTAAAPAYTFLSDINTGFYRIASDVLGIAANGAEVVRIGSGYLGNADGSAAAPAYSFANDLDNGLYRPTTNTVGMSAAGTEVTRWSAGQLSTVLGSASAPAYSFTGDLNNGWYSPSADVQAWSTAGIERMRLTASTFSTSNLTNFDVVTSGQWSAFVATRGIYLTTSETTVLSADINFVNQIGTGTAQIQLRMYEDNDNSVPQYIGLQAPATLTANYVQTYTAATGFIPSLLRATSTLDFPNTGAGGESDLTVTVTGAVVGQPVFVGSTVNPTGHFSGRVTSSNTVTVRYHNTSIVAIDPSSGTFIVEVSQ